MSVENFIEATNWMDMNLEKYFFHKGSSFEDIYNAESRLNVKLPYSYKNFLKRYSYWCFEGSEIYGLYNDDIINYTLLQRDSNKAPTFPNYLVVIHSLGNGELSCLDTSQMNENGECPVVAWYFGATLPNGKLEVLAEDFGAFLLEKIKWGLEQ